MTDDPEKQDKPDYEIGYAKPPKRSRFKKGRSGNPSGRPKGAKSFMTLARKALDETVVINENGVSRTITKREAAAKQLVNKAAMGDLKAFRVLAEALDPEEQRKEQELTALKNGTSARDRLMAKLDAMHARMIAAQEVLSKGKPNI